MTAFSSLSPMIRGLYVAVAYAIIILGAGYFAQDPISVPLLQRTAFGFGLGLMSIGAADGTSYLRAGATWRDGHWWMFAWATGATFAVAMMLAFWTTPDEGFRLFVIWGISATFFGIVMTGIAKPDAQHAQMVTRSYKTDAPIFAKSPTHRAIYVFAPLVFVALLGGLFYSATATDFTLYIAVFFASIQFPFQAKGLGGRSYLTPFNLGLLIAVAALFWW